MSAAKKVAIVQSNYIPWKGYFDLIHMVDEFVLYVAPCVLGDAARPMFRLPPLERMTDRYDFRVHDADRIGDDLRVVLRPQGAGH